MVVIRPPGGSAPVLQHRRRRQPCKRRDGRFIERVGFYNPVASGAAAARGPGPRRPTGLGVGAQVSPTVERLVVSPRRPRPEAEVATSFASEQDGAAAPFFMPGRRTPSRSAHPDAWGVKGWFKVQAYSGHGARSSMPSGGVLRSSGVKPGQRQITITSVREHGGGSSPAPRASTTAVRPSSCAAGVVLAQRVSDRGRRRVLLGRPDWFGVVNRDGAALGGRRLIDTGPHWCSASPRAARSSQGRSPTRSA